MQQPRDLSLGKALEGAKGTSLKDRDDVRSTCTGGVFGALRCPWVQCLGRWMDVLQGKGLEALALTGHPGSKDAGKEWIAPNPDISVSHCHTQHKALAVP